ncbi:hypothetical protein JGS6364_00271 [[Clostridium] sordellii]|uniref:hypothetical protein n=1 Tax=Paraclostridium sordellii TaxID=1505 RepID=UPI0005427787|nr:hypothetical protein [Paeniclostridium sordellii]CEK29381.1 hypothetical protein JGS6364_00271 [[Clostridium] sordellii] [Paeniclostridium sordellii]
MESVYFTSLIGIFSLYFIFTIFMKKKYKITNSQFQEVKSKNINRPVALLIILGILLFIVITLENNTFTVITLGVLLMIDFIYGLRKIKILNEYKYTLYYIGDEVTSLLFAILLMTTMIFK